MDGASTATNLILTGSASKAAYETALEQVRFSNTNPAPDTETRDITVVVNDGTDPSNTAHATILLNNPPSVPVDTDADRRRRHRRCGGRHVGRASTSTPPMWN